MTISQLRHSDERMALPVSLAITVGLLLFFPLPTLGILLIYGLNIWGWQRWLEKKNLWIDTSLYPEWEKFADEFAQRLQIESIPSVVKVDPERWNHRLAMIALKGQYLFIPTEQIVSLEEHHQIGQTAWDLSRKAAGHGTWWHKLGTFLPCLIPGWSSYLSKAEILTIDRITKYALEGSSIPENLPEIIPYQGKNKGIIFYALTDGWKEGVLPWLLEQASTLYRAWPFMEKRNRLYQQLNLEALKASRSQPIKISSNQPSHTELSESDQTSTNMSNSQKVNPRVATIIGFFAGIPLSYFFQSEHLRTKLSLGGYLQELPKIFERAGQDDKFMSIIITLAIVAFGFAAVGYGIAYFANRK